MSDKVSICLLYPDLLGTYGDGGNAVVLAQRLAWRGIDAEVIPVAMGDAVPEQCDVYLMGGGEDQPQTAVTDHLEKSQALHRAVDNGAVVLAVCAGMQVLGAHYAIAGDKTREGLGLLDVTTVRGEGARRVGEITVDPSPEFGEVTMTGYENHGGITMLGANAKPLGRVLTGKGNDDGHGNEGAVNGKVVGTYLHGPVLARNAAFADHLLQWVVGNELTPLDDAEVEALRRERLAKARTPNARANWWQSLRGVVGR